MVNIQVGCVLVHFSIKVVEKNLLYLILLFSKWLICQFLPTMQHALSKKFVNLLSNSVVQLIIFNYFALSHLCDSYKVNIYVKTTCNFWFNNVGKFTEKFVKLYKLFSAANIFFVKSCNVLKKLLFLLELLFHEKNQMRLK